MSSDILYQYLQSIWDFIYYHVIAYFIVKEVGEGWAIFNNTQLFFVICVGLVYAAKPWGLTKWNRNVVKNKRRLRAVAFRKMAEQFAEEREQDKLIWRNISALPFAQLRDELQSGRISAFDAVCAFRLKALECQEKYNCIVQFINEAPRWAQELDDKYKDQKKPPLFGIPFSVKENLCVIGYDCSRGLAKELEWPMKEECSLITHLRALGAIPIARTNVPQTLVSFMCSNPAYGTTLNPFDVTRTPGGSSGGEACLVAAGGCPFGVGSDAAGSLRIPAHFCGLTTLKPTSGRLKTTGAKWALPGVKLPLSCGFFTTDVAAQSLLLQSTFVSEYFTLVPQCAPLPFNDAIQSRKTPMRIGYYVEDGWFRSVPACKRAVMKAKSILESAGHELVPFVIPQPDRAMRLLLKCLFPDNGAYWLDNLKYEDVDANLKITKRLLSLPLWMRRLASVLLGPLDKKASTMLGAYVRNLNDMRATYEDIDAYTKEFFDYWGQCDVDAVIGTVLPFPAVQHQYPTKLSQAVLGTGLYNLLDMPAGVIKVDNVTRADEEATVNYSNCESAKNIVQHSISRMVRKAMAGSEGLPVCVQVVALPYREELCLQIMRSIEDGR